MGQSRQIPLVNSDKTATCDSCCFSNLNQYRWHLPEDGHAARLQPCEEAPDKPHLVLMEDELTFCVGDGCVNCFADDSGWEGYCPECLALWDDHAAGQHDSPVDACRLCR